MNKKSDFVTNLGLLSPLGKYVDFTDKEQQVRYYVHTMLRRMMKAIKLKGLPETIPERNVKLQLFCNGNIVITDKDLPGLYSFTGGWGGEPNAYYLPTQYIVANPYLKYNKVLTIGEDCVMIKNDSMYQGLLPMFNRYATLLVENDITIKIAEINSRLTSLISSDDDVAYNSAVEYLKKVEKGELGIIAESPFLNGIKTQPVTSAGYSNFITQLIELEQYWKASWFNDIGINANYNMKREAIGANESQMNSDSLLPLIDDMFDCWAEGFNEVNEKYGTNITVEFDSSWANRQEQEELELNAMEAEVENLECEDKQEEKKETEEVEEKEEKEDDKEENSD